MSIESPPEPEEPEHEQQRQRVSGWRGFLLRLDIGAVGPIGERGTREMSTMEFEAIDPLGGILHPSWEKRQQEAADRGNRSKGIRVLLYVKDRLAEYKKAYGEPNITTGDTRLDVTPEEMRHPLPLSPQQEADKAAALAAFEGVGPTDTTFYDDLLSSRQPPESPEV